jgi:beta-lactamase superfamily II metal-dependent hydrolase
MAKKPGVKKRSAPAKKSRKRAAKSSSTQPPAEGGARAVASARAFVRIYRHGLGDCILIRIPRAGRSEYKILIDCGVAVATLNAPAKMKEVLNDVMAVTGGEVDVLAVTHEHWDHVSGFSQAQDIFDKLAVGEVWLAWTEDPTDPLAKKLRADHTAALAVISQSAQTMALGGNQSGANQVLTLTGMFGAAGEKTQAALNLAKAKVPRTGKPRYWLPSDPPLAIPGGPKVYALGPPHDEKAIRNFNPSKSHPETYELALDGSGLLPLGVLTALQRQNDVTPFADSSNIPIEAARGVPFFQRSYWGLPGEPMDWRRIDTDWLSGADEFALMLQSATNNTSLVLALEFGDGDVLLFAGDAQVGNWMSWGTLEWKQSGSETVTGLGLLGRTVFYKVGHHGSHNATLKEKGLDLMTKLETAIIPVDEVVAKKMRWGAMPLAALVTALETRTRSRTLRTDQNPANQMQGIESTSLYFEVSV